MRPDPADDAPTATGAFDWHDTGRRGVVAAAGIVSEIGQQRTLCGHRSPWGVALCKQVEEGTTMANGAADARPPRGRSMRPLAWLATMVPISVAIAWIGVDLEEGGFAPLGLHSLAIGLLLGGATVVALRVTNVASRWAVVVAIVIVAPATACFEHLVAYAHYRANYHRAIESDPRIALVAGDASRPFAPAPLIDYLRARADARSVRLWVLDIVLLATGASLPLLIALRSPYCRPCRAWCRTVRSGPLTAEEVAGWRRQLAIDVPDGATDVRFHAAVCRAGCRHDRMRLSWRDGTCQNQSGWVEGDSMARCDSPTAPA